MKKSFRVLTMLTAFAVMFTSTINGVGIENIGTTEPITPIVPVETHNLSAESVAFLKEHNVDLSLFENDPADIQLADDEILVSASYDESVKILMRVALTNKFTDEQINAYVRGILDDEPLIIKKSDVSVQNNEPISNRVLREDKGLGWEVDSNDDGYCGATALATIPEIINPHSSVAPYLMYSIYHNGIYVDFGYTCQYDSTVNAYKWFAATYGMVPVGKTGTGTYWDSSNEKFYYLNPGDKVYFQAVFQDNGYLWVRLYNGIDYVTEYANFYLDVGQKWITSTNASFNRQITLADNPERTGCFTSGTIMRNATFENAYLYRAGEVYGELTGPSNVNVSGCGKFAPMNEDETEYIIDINNVVVNSYEEWYEENVTLTMTRAS